MHGRRRLAAGARTARACQAMPLSTARRIPLPTPRITLRAARPNSLELAHPLGDGVRVAQERRLGELERQLFGREGRLLEHVGHLVTAVNVVVTGDVDPKNAIALVEKYWSGWKRGTYNAAVPAEPAPKGTQPDK